MSLSIIIMSSILLIRINRFTNRLIVKVHMSMFTLIQTNRHSTIRQQRYNVRMTIFSRQARMSMRRHRRRSASVDAVRVNVNRRSSLIMTQLFSIGTLTKTNTRRLSSNYTLLIKRRLHSQHLLRIRSLTSGQRRYLRANITYNLNNARYKVALSSRRFNRIIVTQLTIKRFNQRQNKFRHILTTRSLLNLTQLSTYIRFTSSFLRRTTKLFLMPTLKTNSRLARLLINRPNSSQLSLHNTRCVLNLTLRLQFNRTYNSRNRRSNLSVITLRLRNKILRIRLRLTNIIFRHLTGLLNSNIRRAIRIDATTKHLRSIRRTRSYNIVTISPSRNSIRTTNTFSFLNIRFTTLARNLNLLLVNTLTLSTPSIKSQLTFKRRISRILSTTNIRRFRSTQVHKLFTRHTISSLITNHR